MKPRLTVTADFTDQFKRVLKRLRNDDVLVGIPESASARDDDSINNAALLAINEFGSPINNIPPRPVMSIGIRNSQDEVAEQFKLAASGALSNAGASIDKHYERAGIIASNSIKKAINDQEGIEPPSESTLRSRERRGFKGTKALIVTGQLRNAITYVVRSK